MKKAVSLFLLALSALPQFAWANSCWSGPVSHIDFGDVSPQGGTAVGSISAVCQKSWTDNNQPTHFRLCMTIPGGVPIASVFPRVMSDYRGSTLNYDLYSNPSHTTGITTTLSGTVYTTTRTITGTGSAQSTITFPVYARLPPGQFAAANNHQSQNYANIYWVVSTTSMPPASSCMSGSVISGVYQSVSAAWENSCFIASANDLGFGVHPSLSSATQSQTNLSIACPNGTPWHLGLGPGSHFSGQTRRMKHVASNSFLSYQLYQNQARTTPWGSTPGVNTRSGTGNGSTQVIPLFGTAPAQSVPAPGVYQDNVQVILTY